MNAFARRLETEYGYHKQHLNSQIQHYLMARKKVSVSFRALLRICAAFILASVYSGEQT